MSKNIERFEITRSVADELRRATKLAKNSKCYAHSYFSCSGECMYNYKLLSCIPKELYDNTDGTLVYVLQHSPKLKNALERTLKLIEKRGGLPEQKQKDLDKYMRGRVGTWVWNKFKDNPSIENSDEVLRELIKHPTSKNRLEILLELVKGIFSVFFYFSYHTLLAWIKYTKGFAKAVVGAATEDFKTTIEGFDLYLSSTLSFLFLWLTRIVVNVAGAAIASVFGAGAALLAGQLLVATIVLFSLIDSLTPAHWSQGASGVFEKLRYWLFGIERSWIEENLSGKPSSEQTSNFFSRIYNQVTRPAA